MCVCANSVKIDVIMELLYVAVCFLFFWMAYFQLRNRAAQQIRCRDTGLRARRTARTQREKRRYKQHRRYLANIRVI